MPDKKEIKVGIGCYVEPLSAVAVSPKGIRASEIVRNAVISAIPKSEKSSDLPSRTYDLRAVGMPEACVSVGGKTQ